MLPITGWELIYADGSVVTSAETTWGKAPVTGVLLLVILHDPPYADVSYAGESYLLPGQPARTAKTGVWVEDEASYGVVDGVFARMRMRR